MPSASAFPHAPAGGPAFPHFGSAAFPHLPSPGAVPPPPSGAPAFPHAPFPHAPATATSDAEAQAKQAIADLAQTPPDK